MYADEFAADNECYRNIIDTTAALMSTQCGYYQGPPRVPAAPAPAPRSSCPAGMQEKIDEVCNRHHAIVGSHRISLLI